MTLAVAGAVLVLAVGGAAGGDKMDVAAGMPPGGDSAGRAELLADIETARAAYTSDPADTDARVRLAELTYEAGSFEEAGSLLEPLVSGDASNDVLMLAARIEYLSGRFDRAEELLNRVLELEPDNARAAAKLVFVHYQTNSYDKCGALADRVGDRPLPHLDLMLAFEDEPYRAEWESGDATEVPFLVTDPLPVIEVEVDGRKVTALIDTGGDCFILDPGIAEELGIEIAASMMGMFAGGMEAEVGFAMAQTLKLGGVTLHSVPISVLPTGGMQIGGHQLDGIVGTGVLKQFLSTIDYPGDRLVLRDPNGDAAAAFRAGGAGRVFDEVPFYIQSTHFLVAPGSLNGLDGLMFHVDSGLAGTAAFSAPEQTLDYVGIPVPETAVNPNNVGGGGGGFATGTFDVARLGLGELEQTDLVGSFGGLPPQSFRMLGFLQDGLISHNFLRAYSWTLDFERMLMVFAE